MKAERQVDNSERGFEQLHRRTQIRRLRRLAEVALAAYDLPPVSMTLLAHLFNTTFRVDTATGQRYVLRIHRAGTPTLESVGAELDWLAALRRDTTLEVPAPVPTRAGPLLILAATPGVPQPHICVLFHWLPGRLLRHGLTPRHMERTGELMARLQNHARQWGPPPGFTRGRVDWPIEAARWVPDPFAQEVIASIHTLVARTLSVAEAERVMAVLERVRTAEQALGQGPDTFGLIHADLHYGNLLFARGTVRAIDFDDCGFGPLLYDPAVMFNEILDWPEYPALRARLLAGYRRVRPLPAEHEAHLDTFIALRRIQDALWVLDWRKHPGISGDWAAQAQRSLAPIGDLAGICV
ncbi:MAG TPA: phosphotransferase [Chloroflexia bacterium]|nr:phosphotransferase [Chloroflexia bacterium]